MIKFTPYLNLDLLNNMRKFREISFPNLSSIGKLYGVLSCIVGCILHTYLQCILFVTIFLTTYVKHTPNIPVSKAYMRYGMYLSRYHTRLIASFLQNFVLLNSIMTLRREDIDEMQLTSLLANLDYVFFKHLFFFRGKL